MAKHKLTIRYKRSVPGDHSSYGPAVERAIAKLTGPGAKLSTRSAFPRQKLSQGGGYVERHEDGPEILITILQELPNYIAAAVALVTAWNGRKKSKPSEKTVMTISGKDFNHSIEIKDEEDRKLAQKLLRHYGKVVGGK